MRHKLQIVLLLAIAFVAIGPLLSVTGGNLVSWLSPNVIAGLNLLGWSLILTLLLSRFELTRTLESQASSLGIERSPKSLEDLLAKVLRELERKNSALSINSVERRISSKEELSRALERIVNMAFKLLEAESAELALFDRDSGFYHSSFVLGKPFRTSAQAMLSGAMDGESEESNSPDVLVQPIAFSGSVLGSLRVALAKGALPTTGDQEIVRLLALHGSMAIINAQYSDELVKMKRYAEESVKAKTGFLANLSHEIRGPLGIMLNAVELVLDGLCGPVSSDQLDTLKMVRQNGEHLLELINDVLDYAKVESGRIVPDPTEIIVQDLLKDISQVVRTQADAKKHVLNFKPNDEVLAIGCDRRHIRQMLINMLTNAIKYTPDGGSIDIWAERVPGSKVKLNVKDSGIGIDAKDRHKVFAAFERIENSYSIQQVGTGLGMPLTRRLAEVNGGLIDFTSTPGKGSHFWLIFPSIEADPALSRLETEEDKEAEGKGSVVLLVEADEAERGMYVKYLNHIGFMVITAGSKLEALQSTKGRNIDIVLLGSSFIDSSDHEIISTLRSENNMTSVPIVVLSSRAFVFDVEKYLKAGVDRCLSKPVELKKLGQTIREIIDHRLSGAMQPKVSEKTGTNLAVKLKSPRSKALAIDDIFH